MSKGINTVANLRLVQAVFILITIVLIGGLDSGVIEPKKIMAIQILEAIAFSVTLLTTLAIWLIEIKEKNEKS